MTLSLATEGYMGEPLVLGLATEGYVFAPQEVIQVAKALLDLTASLRTEGALVALLTASGLVTAVLEAEEALRASEREVATMTASWREVPGFTATLKIEDLETWVLSTLEFEEPRFSESTVEATSVVTAVLESRLDPQGEVIPVEFSTSTLEVVSGLYAGLD